MRMLTFPDLQQLKGIPYSREHIRRLEKAGRFPKRVDIGPGRKAWVESEIDDHLQALADARKGVFPRPPAAV